MVKSNELVRGFGRGHGAMLVVIAVAAWLGLSFFVCGWGLVAGGAVVAGWSALEGRLSALSNNVATRWSLMYRSAWSSMSEFPYEDGGCPGPEAREYVES